MNGGRCAWEMPRNILQMVLLRVSTMTAFGRNAFDHGDSSNPPKKKHLRTRMVRSLVPRTSLYWYYGTNCLPILYCCKLKSNHQSH